MLTKAYTEGFHGTSLGRAKSILANGFDCEDGIICFATPDNPEMAHEFGRYWADRDGDDQYALIHTEFPSTVPELWPIPLQVRVPAGRAAEIVIKSLTDYRIADSGLYMPNPSLPIADQISYARYQ